MIKLGLLTNSLVGAGLTDIDAIASWAVQNGFQDLELGPTITLDEAAILKAKETHKIETSALIYCRDFLCADEDKAKALMDGLLERIAFAPKIGADKVITTTGASPTSYIGGSFYPENSVEAVKRAFYPALELAEKLGVRILLEICPFMGNIAISPYMWDILFDAIPSDKFGIAFDPSHLVWQFIEPYTIIGEYSKRIGHVHGKDCRIDADQLRRAGSLHMFRQNPDSRGRRLWWEYRLPGLGDLDWGRIVSNLYDTGFEGTISMEHEDPVWEGSETKVKKGLLASKRHISSPLIFGLSKYTPRSAPSSR